jgi:hypothetical protein
MLARVRKAVIAGLSAGVSVAVGAIVTAGSLDREQVSKAIGAGVAAAVVAGWATWKVPNEA